MKRIALMIALSLAAGHASAVGYLADIGVYDRSEQRSLQVYWHDGKAWIAGRPGNEYQISVRNQAGQDVLAVVSVDGVNAISGETATTSQGGYVLGGWQSLDIKGWRKSLDRTAAFYFTTLPDSYATRTARPDNVGVIGVALFRRKVEQPPVWLNAPAAPLEKRGWEHERSRAAESPAGAGVLQEQSGVLNSQSAPLRDDKLGTGHGRNETSYARQTVFERASSSPEEVVTLYYDSYANLVARGIIPADYRPQRPREPQPFPRQFTPDPPPRW